MNLFPPSLSPTEKARIATLLNLTATPGLGSLLAGRKAVGTLQIALALSGFVLILLWLISLIRIALAIWQETPPPDALHLFGISGAGLFLTAWLWALSTSLAILHKARKETPHTGTDN